ncbi:MAG: hypothetical protein AAF850_01185 [Pseudomonadota bacterium]
MKKATLHARIARSVGLAVGLAAAMTVFHSIGFAEDAPTDLRSDGALEATPATSSDQASSDQATAEATQAFVEGRYEDAVEIAEASAAPADLALAARAINTDAYFETDREKARDNAKRAYDFAVAALEKDPSQEEAHLQAAISLAVRGDNMSPAKAFFLRLPTRSRRFIDDALALNPENPWALSTSAAWRLEVARRGGGRIFGADPDEGAAECAAAREQAPENVAIAYECALRLLAHGEENWRDQALTALDAALNNPPSTAFEKQLQKRAGTLRSAVDAGGDALVAFIDHTTQ